METKKREKVIIRVDGKIITEKEMTTWKKERIKDVTTKLELSPILDGDVDEMMDKLAKQKLQFTHEEIEEKLGKMLKKGNNLTKMAILLSGKKKKFCLCEIEIPGVSAEHALREYEKTQLVNTPEHNLINMRANPDHYYLHANTPKELEVIETCGNNVVPAQFYIRYGSEEGLRTPKDPKAAGQSAGVAVFKNGKLQGGVRHQFYDTPTGSLAKLCVEMPGMMSDELVHQHDMHLACEFGYWLQWVIDERPEKDWRPKEQFA